MADKPVVLEACESLANAYTRLIDKNHTMLTTSFALSSEFARPSDRLGVSGAKL